MELGTFVMCQIFKSHSSQSFPHSLRNRKSHTDTGQSTSSLVKVPIEILPQKRQITWVSAPLLFLVEFQMEPPLLMLFPSIVAKKHTQFVLA